MFIHCMTIIFSNLTGKSGIKDLFINTISGLPKGKHMSASVRKGVLEYLQVLRSGLSKEMVWN